MTIKNSEPNHISNQWFTERSDYMGSGTTLKISSHLHSEQTPYQKIDIYQTQTFGNLLVIDDFVMLTTRDNFIYHEMMVHPALFNHPNPTQVAIVGGGDCGTLQQVLKHSCVKKVSQIEIDERVTRLSEQYIPELCSSNNDPRAEFLYLDAIEWMQQQPTDSLDIIIVDSTDPIGPAEGLFKQNFYQDCIRVLRSDGILVQQSESPLLHWKSISLPMQSEMKKASFTHISPIFFPLPVYPSGWWSATLASQSSLHLVRDKQAQNNPFETHYYNYSVHLAAFAKPNFLVE
jgi:spermidine synthase